MKFLRNEKLATGRVSSVHERVQADERVQKRVCFTSKHSFARIVPSCVSLSSLSLPLSGSIPPSTFLSVPPMRAHVSAPTTCVTRTISRIRRRVASLSFPTPLGKRPPTNRTSPRVKTLNCTARGRRGAREGLVTDERGLEGGKKNRSKLKQWSRQIIRFPRILLTNSRGGWVRGENIDGDPPPRTPVIGTLECGYCKAKKFYLKR